MWIWPPTFDDTSTWERAYQQWDRHSASDLARCLHAEGVGVKVIADVAARYALLRDAFPHCGDISSRFHWLDRSLKFCDWAKMYVDVSVKTFD